jgi:hypothetical protein
VRTAIDGLLSYVETVIETALAEGVDRERVVAMVAPALSATIDAAVSAAAESRISSG